MGMNRLVDKLKLSEGRGTDVLPGFCNSQHFMGGFVTFVLVALYLPIFSLADTLR